MKISNSLLILFMVLALSSCYRAPDDTVFVSDLDMVSTNYSSDIDYKTEYLTYSIADSFGLASNVKSVTVDDVNDPKFRTLVKNQLIQNMDAYGYQMTAATDTPDIYIPVTISYINTTGVSYYPIYSPGYGYGYPGYGYGYGGGYYYGWSYIPTSYSYDQGSILIDWIDVKNRKDPIAPDTVWIVEQVWSMGISGLNEESGSEDERNEKIKKAIDIGFNQSTYLKK